MKKQNGGTFILIEIKSWRHELLECEVSCSSFSMSVNTRIRGVIHNLYSFFSLRTITRKLKISDAIHKLDEEWS